jgi:asparagine synthase (glutamine-hydrolysing)
MSALAGLVRFDGGPADAATVARMLDCVEHRGRDERLVRLEGSAAMGWRWQRTGLSQPVDDQPLIDRLAKIALVFDGRLDNRPDLARDLSLEDDESVTDAVFVAAAYRRWGSAMLPNLLGDFALALWDGRAHRLTLARDPRGVRSLAYATGPGWAAFATEPRQLLRVRGVDSAPNPGFVAERLSGFVTSQSETIFRGVLRVPAAHLVTMTSGDSAGVAVARHWDVEPTRTLRYADEREYADHLRELMTSAVDARLRGLDRAAVLLSGGVDSSAVTVIAARPDANERHEIRAYHHALRGFPEAPEASEEKEAQAVARQCGIPFVAIGFDGADLGHHLERARVLEDTIPGTLGSSDDLLTARMAGDGCSVGLSGVGGDEWFAGSYLHTSDLLRSGRVFAAARQLWADGHNPDAFHGVAVLARSCASALTPDAVRSLVRRFRPSPDLVPPGFNRRFARELSLADRLAPPPLERRFAMLADAATFRAAMHPHGIYAWEESGRQASLFGISFSAPLLDRRIAEFAMAIPEEQRWFGTLTKRVLRASVAGLLDDDVRMRRRKSDPGAAVYRQLIRLQDEGALSRMELADAGILDAAAVGAMSREMRDAFAAGQDRYKVLAYRLWTFVAVECVWRALFGRSGRLAPSNAEREEFRGAEAAEARCG